MNDRVDLYRGVHKGMRRVLGSLTSRAGQTDFGSPSEVEALAAAMADAFALMESHGHHEDTFVMPLVRKHAPDVAARLDREHGEHEHRFEDLLHRVAQLAASGRADARTGHGIVVALSRLAGELTLHMADEEELAQPVLHRACDDAELGAAHAALVASIPPETMMRFLGEMLPAMNGPERADFLSHMAEGAPPEAIRGVIEIARTTLAAPDFEALEQGASTAFARAA